jgi:hypothetical protein
MIQAPPPIHKRPVLLDTLAQPIPHRHQQGFQPMILPGKDATKEGKKKLQKKAKGVYFAKELARHLSQLDSPLNKSYRRTLFDCCGTIMQEGSKFTSRYCNGRWCNTCNRIRTAKLIKGYAQPLAEMKEGRHVVLTIVNVRGSDLKAAIEGMTQTFINIQRCMKREGNPLKGIRKLECTYNAENDDYHPHYHFIVDGEHQANRLIDEWLTRYPTARRECQRSTPVDAGSAMELFKYVTKLVTSSKKKAHEGFKIYVPALDTIFQAMAGKRTFQPFGGIKMVTEDVEGVQAEDIAGIPEYEFAVWEWSGNDWRHIAGGEMLAGYKPSKQMKRLVTECMIT